MNSPVVHHLATTTIKARHISEETQQRCELAPWDVAMLSDHYIQKGFVFHRPPSSQSQEKIMDRLKDSLAAVLVYFYPLAGRLSTERDSHTSSSHVFIDCNNAGAEFIHAAVDMTVADVLTPVDVPPVVKSFFTLSEAVNHDGHVLPLLSVQFTELTDGVFLGCSFNHVVGDGTSFWRFLNAWSEISRSQGGIGHISHPPVIQRCFLDVDKSLIRLPFSNPDEFIERYETPPLRERIFHFAPKAIAQLKSKANNECKTDKISSFQALCALVWRSIIRARGFPLDQKTSCRLAIGNRPRLQPPLSPDYFGNCINVTSATASVGDLLSHDLGWAAWLLHQSVAAHNDGVVPGTVKAWVMAPMVYHISEFDRYSVMVGSSPRFDMYCNDFGWGKPLGLRSGYANKFDGKVSSYPGREGRGSVDLEICLPPESMSALESDGDFMDAVSPSVL
ncbi:protein ENHANCED PSEUDOMONAS SUSCEPTIBILITY 1-like [Magnolia sinica]|uniref:protein ENHANCED PSEUDOMONAS SUSCEPTIBILITY 1-like n=1 Tax=Magnolia sinica TaxID=86752 RepID=UPI00265A9283|nr:protein ENHANCED PSEUDOMONAS SUSCEPTIBILITY 1-like [Magnolia sinica]